MSTLTFARKATDQTRRDLRFIRDLQRTVAVHLHEITRAAPDVAPPKAAQWRTLRVRPEIIAVIEGLQQRYAATTGRDLTTSEIIAAALAEALPIMTSREFR
jgi:hypothetical protein